MTELAELASYMENPLDRSLPNYPMVGGPWHHMFTSTDTCRSKDFCGT